MELYHSDRGNNRVYGYKKISLDKILQISGDSGGELKFMFARQIAPFGMETELASLYIKRIIVELKEVNLDILQWGDDKFSRKNPEKGIFVEPQTLDGNKYYISVQSRSQLDKNIKVRDVYLDINEISKMIKEPGLEYMKEPLDYLVQKGKVTKIKVNTDKGKSIEKEGVNILDFWGLSTLYYIVEVSKHIFGIDKYKIDEFKDEIKLANKDKFDISGYELTFKYKEKELRFRIYDASHIYGEEAKKYGIEKNGYIALALYSGSGYILLEEDFEKPSVDEKIRDFYRKAREVTGYDIITFIVDEQPLIETKKIDKVDYVKIIRKNEIPYIIDIIRDTYKI